MDEFTAFNFGNIPTNVGYNPNNPWANFTVRKPTVGKVSGNDARLKAFLAKKPVGKK